ncbi:M16 family metallopeptidase [Rhodospirillum centenum]|uniref:Peptidase, M16 family, putative n=1 Tax=Rhodospirillum centenum (strain ATCC 51521 / SW) TaxID=414684 RepID=B6IXB4_RHOCS|nr:pitrilysin family protein [Rhodospirillum centenum]ACJ00938.1 peptidase, M16 family, putative [Rhodospirillum centenum SW]
MTRFPVPRPMPRLRSAAAGAALLALVALSPPAVAKVFEPETFTLSNGMQVVVVTNRRAPVVSHMLWYKVGAADEPPGRSGIAHYLEHLMFKGTDDIPSGEFSKIIARNGGRDNAFTSYDYTAYFQNIARDRLDLVMKMEADRMADLSFTEEVAKPELAVVMEERRQRTENDPASRLWEQQQSMLFVHHPYGVPIIGWMHEIARLGRDDAFAFYRTWYAPNNAVLVVSGDITAAELKPLAEKYYGAVAARPVPPRQRTEEPPTEGERRITLHDAQVRQPSWSRVWKAPSYTTGAKEHAYALQVLETVLSGGATSRLYRTLVVEQKVAAGVSMSYSPTSLDLGTLGVSATPMPGTDVAALETAVEAVLASVLKDGVTAEEVATAKTRMVREATFARDSLQGPAYAFGMALTTGQTVADVEAWPDRIAAVTAEQVNAAARAVLGRDDHVTGVLLPEAAAPAGASPAAAAPSSPVPPTTAGSHTR